MEKMTKTYINFIEKMTKACVCQRFTHKNACGNVNMCRWEIKKATASSRRSGFHIINHFNYETKSSILYTI